jgi:serine/threonine protein kinase
MEFLLSSMGGFPLDTKQGRDMREIIIRHVHTKGFEYFRSLLNSEKPFSWQKEIPALAKIFEISKSKPPITRSLVNEMIKIHQFRNAYLKLQDIIPPQQFIMMVSILTTFFKKGELVEVWPISINMDTISQDSGDVKMGLRGMGPIIMKLFQQITGGDMNPEFSKMSEDVFNETDPLTSNELKYVKKRLDIPNVFTDNIGSLLGSASIAEARNTIDQYGKASAIKFLKPQGIFYFLCEREMIRKFLPAKIEEITKWHLMLSGEADNIVKLKTLIKLTTDLIDYSVNLFKPEFDYQLEAQYTALGHKAYHRPSQSVRSVEIINYSTKNYPVIVMTKAPGISLGRFIKIGSGEYKAKGNDYINRPVTRQHIKDVRSYLNNLQDLWCAECLFGKNGFHHADLHPGNIIVSPDRDYITVIDYGSTAFLSQKEVCFLLKLNKLASSYKKLDRDSTKYVVNFKASSEDVKYFNGDQHLADKLLSIPNNRKRHNKNKKIQLRFAQYIVTLCLARKIATIPFLLYEPTQILADQQEARRFSTMFINCFIKMEDIAECMDSAIVSFGRGISYIQGAMTLLWEISGDTFYNAHTIDKAVMKGLFLNPKMTANLLLDRPC